jgi:hypothetical protein
MMACRTVAEAVRELYFWQFQDATNFTAQLYSLIAKADYMNRSRLQGAFPMEFNAFMLWEAAKDQNEFFKQWEAIADGSK